MKHSCENPDCTELRHAFHELIMKEGALLLRVLELEERVRKLEARPEKREATVLTFRRVSV